MIYQKEIQHGEKVGLDFLCLTETDDGYNIWLVTHSDYSIHIMFIVDRDEAVRTAVNLGEIFQAQAETRWDRSDNIDFLKYVLGYREGLLKDSGLKLIDILERQRQNG